MKPIVLVTGAIAIFGVGFVAGHYQSTDPEAQIDITNTARQGERSPLTVNTMPNKAGFPVSRTSQTDGSDLQPIQVQQHGKSQAAPSPPVLPPHERVFSIEERAQWEAQQREARKTRLAEVDAMIHSMESAGFPEEQVKKFSRTEGRTGKSTHRRISSRGFITSREYPRGDESGFRGEPRTSQRPRSAPQSHVGSIFPPVPAKRREPTQFFPSCPAPARTPKLNLTWNKS